METALIEFELLQMGADAGALLIQRIVQIQQLCSRIRKGFILMQRMQQAIAFIDGRNASPSSKEATIPVCGGAQLFISSIVFVPAPALSSSSRAVPHVVDFIQLKVRNSRSSRVITVERFLQGILHGTVAVVALASSLPADLLSLIQIGPASGEMPHYADAAKQYLPRMNIDQLKRSALQRKPLSCADPRAMLLPPGYLRVTISRPSSHSRPASCNCCSTAFSSSCRHKFKT